MKEVCERHENVQAVTEVVTSTTYEIPSLHQPDQVLAKCHSLELPRYKEKGDEKEPSPI